MRLEFLFPTPIGFFDFRTLTEKEISFISKQKRKVNSGNKISENTYLLDSKELAKVKQELEKYCVVYMRECWKIKKEIKPRITQSWVNWTATGEFHPKHFHRNSVFSGVLYIDAKEGVDTISFHQENFDWIFPTYEEYTRWNSDSWWLHVKTGDLILFPSKLIHSVECPEEAKERLRISLAFNVFVTGTLGNEHASTELKL